MYPNHVVMSKISLDAHRHQQAISPDAALYPDWLPACGKYAVGQCQGDGTTLKERLEALDMVGEVTIRGISGGLENVTNDAVVCGVDGVSGCFRATTDYLIRFRFYNICRAP